MKRYGMHKELSCDVQSNTMQRDESFRIHALHTTSVVQTMGQIHSIKSPKRGLCFRASFSRSHFVWVALFCLACFSRPCHSLLPNGQLPSIPRSEGILFVVEPKVRSQQAHGTFSTTPSRLGQRSSFEPIIVSSNADQNSDDGNVPESPDGEAQDSNDQSDGEYEDKDAETEILAKASQAAPLLSRCSGNIISGHGNSDRSTGVGTRRVGNESLAQDGSRSITRPTDALRKGATANTAHKKEASNDPMSEGNHGALLPAMVSKSLIQATVENMIQSSGSMGFLGDPSQFEKATDRSPRQEPAPCTVLVQSAKSTKPWRPADRVTGRVASTADDLDIANLRLSVFSDFSPDMRKAFCAKSCQVLSSRRNRGATCIVATVPRYGSILNPKSSDIILGTAECSFHEFQETALGKQRHHDAILYITEVAVSPAARRKGIGQKLMQSIDQLAAIRGVETLYLHVDVNNHEALSLYERAGYSKVSATDHRYEEYTRSLNLHDGATKGRNHYMLHKDVLQATWVPEREDETQKGTLGFVITA